MIGSLLVFAYIELNSNIRNEQNFQFKPLFVSEICLSFCTKNKSEHLLINFSYFSSSASVLVEQEMASGENQQQLLEVFTLQAKREVGG